MKSEKYFSSFLRFLQIAAGSGFVGGMTCVFVGLLIPSDNGENAKANIIIYGFGGLFVAAIIPFIIACWFLCLYIIAEIAKAIRGD
jgi:hypothetical protein